MACLLLALAGPGQSWGTSSRFKVRDSGTEPSKSGVVGLLASALGRARNEPISDLAALRMGVRVDAEGTLQRDFQTAQGAIRADGSNNKDAVTSSRHFLADAAFLVALEGESEFIELLEAAMAAPRWPLFLGRKAFPPAGPVLRGVQSGSLADGLAHGPWTDPSKRRTEQLRRRIEGGETVKARTIVDVAPADATDFRNDEPLSFEPRRFIRRSVQVGVVPVTTAMLQVPAVTS